MEDGGGSGSIGHGTRRNDGGGVGLVLEDDVPVHISHYRVQAEDPRRSLQGVNDTRNVTQDR
jgi:hypothetical protein